jgi:hypothetical protein
VWERAKVFPARACLLGNLTSQILVSAKSHILLPRFVDVTDLDSPRVNVERFHHMTRREADVMFCAGRIHRLGEKLWQLTDDSLEPPSWNTGKGRLSLEVDGAVQILMAAEMRRRPAWSVSIEEL